METILNFESATDFVDLIECDSPANLLQLMRTGWPEGVSAVNNLFDNLRLTIKPELFPKEFLPAKTGLFFDIGLVCSGVPEHWLGVEPEEGSFKNNVPNEIVPVNLGMNISTIPSFSRSSTIEKGAAVIVLACLMQMSHRSVSITQYCSISKGKETFKGSVVLKSQDEALDIDFLSFWLSCPESFRQSWTHVIEKAPNAKGLGIFDEERGFPIADYGKEYVDVFAPGVEFNNMSWTQEDSISWICSQLEAQGIKFNS